MSDYDTLNPVPSSDPRDLDDNATNLDRLMLQEVPSVPDRLGIPRKTWWQIEQDANALVSPNVTALSGLTGAANQGFYFTGAGAMALYSLSSLGRTLAGIANAAAGRSALGAISASDNITGSAATLTTSRSISATGDATWTVNFNGSANATAAITLAASGVAAGTYGSVTVNTKGLVTAATAATPIANGGTNATSALAAGTNLGTSTVGTNTDQLARSAMIQAEIANKRAWTSYTPTVTPSSGTFTSISATGKYMVAFGICHIQIVVTVTTKGTGTFPVVGLPQVGLAGSNGMPLLAREAASGKMGYGILTFARDAIYLAGYDASDLSATGASITINSSYPIA